jgi:hypothetical protein
MAPLPNAHRPLLPLLEAVLLIALPMPAAFAQSSSEQSSSGQSSFDQTSAAHASTDGAYRLKVAKVNYDREKDTVEFTLQNSGDKAVTAYEVSVTALADGKQIGLVGMASDLLQTELQLQCSDLKSQPGHPEGAIQPGALHTQSMRANVNQSKLNGASASVRVEVKGIIWADGAIEGSSDVPMGIADMKRMRDSRLRDSDEEAKVLAIFNAHPEETDIQRRIAQAIADLDSLKNDYPHDELLPEGQGSVMHVATSAVYDNTLRNLEHFQSSPAPGEMFAFYQRFLTCEHEHRVAMIQPCPTTTPVAEITQ